LVISDIFHNFVLNFAVDMKDIFRSILFAIALCSASSLAGQDLLTHQVTIDKKMKAIDSLAAHKLMERDRFTNPAMSLYGSWGERYVRTEQSIPDSFRIDLTDFSLPTTSHVVTSNFGLRRGHQHKGIDIKVFTGDTIRSAFSGKVRIVRYDERGGNYIVIRHHNGLETIYGHMAKTLVRQDQAVYAGTPIGLGGSTGRVADAHLHFETRLCGVAIDPAQLFDFRMNDVKGDSYLFRKNGNSALASKSNKPEENASQSQYHKVVKGETLGSIARKRGTTVDRLCQLNHIGRNARLHIGQILKYN